MAGVIIENVVNILGELLIMLIGILGVWLTTRLNKWVEVTNINAAQQEVIAMAQITVGELQQTVVEKLKAAHEDGKLTREEINSLGYDLINLTIAKLSDPTRRLLDAAGVDIVNLIRGAGEDWIRALKE